jgi:hypothetical protein
MKAIISITLIILCFCIHLKSQEIKVPDIDLSYGLVAKTFEDSIVLRWAPTSPNALPPHIEAGVWIEKLIVNGTYPYELGNWQRINTSPIKPEPIESFNNERSKKDIYQMMVAQALYGKTPKSPALSEVEQVKDESEMLSNLFYSALLACDYSAIAAQKMGMRHTIKTKIKQNEKIFFRVYSAFDHPLFIVDTAMVFATFGEWNINDAPKFLQASSQEKLVELSWPHNKDLMRWSGFYIERSNDGINYKRLNERPFITMTEARNTTNYFKDSVDNYMHYFYRVQAIDPFGDLTEFSEVVESWGSDKTAPGDITLEGNNTDFNGITLHWKFNQGRADSDLSKFIVKRGPAINNLPDTIASIDKNTYSYYDPYKAKTRSTYYEISAIDTAGNIKYSNVIRYFMPDSEPPMKPINVVGSIDTLGIVSITWPLDTLDELIGYRVYRTNDLSHKFVCLQQGYLETNSFKDTLELKMLTEDVYYAVCAVDISYNHSIKSEPIHLVKPDVVPPIPPQIVHYQLGDGGALIEWSHSPSNDVVSYEISRTLLSDTTKIMKKLMARENNKFEDTGLVHGEMYEYSIVSIDKVNLISEPSFPLNIKAYSNKTTEELKLFWLDDKDKNGFKWNSIQKKPIFFIVYKDTGIGLEQYKNLPPSSNEFIESHIKSNDKLRYGLQAIYENQVKSDLYILNWKSN